MGYLRFSTWMLVTLLAFGCSPSAEQTASSPEAPTETPAPSVEPQADEILKAMSEHLAGASAFAVRAEQRWYAEAAETPSREKSLKLLVNRPNQLRASRSGSGQSRDVVFDGSTLSVIFEQEKAWAAMELPGTVDEMADFLATERGLYLYLADLFAASPYDSLMVPGTSGTYGGQEDLDGTPCHRLSYNNPDIKWTLWVDAGDSPLPKRLDLHHDSESVTFSATLSDWSLSPEISAEAFVFEPPEGFEQIEFTDSSEQGDA